MTSPLQYMKEFNSYVNLYQKQRTLEVENFLNRNLSLLSGVQNLQVFRPDNLECSQFYISLYEILKRLDFRTGSDLGIACLTVLQRATRNLDARQDLLNQFRFVPLLAKLLEDTLSKDIIMRILELMQDLSYGIQITWEEPYLADLIQKLVKLIYSEEIPVGGLALSVLINICYKNTPSIYLLFRVAHISTFTKKIKPYGILAYKMLIIIDNCIDTPGLGNIHNFIKKSLSDIGDCFQTLNVPYLKHIVEFLTDSTNNQTVKSTLHDYPEFNSDIDRLLEQIDDDGTKIGPFETRSEKEQGLAQCYALVFVLFESFLRAGLGQLSLASKFFKLALKWVETEDSSAKALDLMNTIVTIDDGEAVKYLKDFETIIPKILSRIEKNGMLNNQIIALFKVMISLLRHTKMQTIVLSTFTESYFDKMFSTLINTNPESLNYAKFSSEELGKYLLCLQILIEFSHIAPTVWQSKVTKLFEMKQIHYVMARGILCENEDLCQVVFEMAKTSNFPRDDVAKITSKLSPLVTVNNAKGSTDAGKHFNESRMTENLWINESLVDRLEKLIGRIIEAKSRSEFNNVATSELIELFHYKINLCQNTEKNLVKKLEHANDEITNLSHRINLLAHEMSQYYSMNFKLHLTQERLQAENKDYLNQRDILKESSNELMKMIESDRKKYQSYLISLEAKKTEVEVLRKELESYKEQDTIKNAQLKKYEAERCEMSSRIEQLKKTIHKYEEMIAENRTLLEQREKENVKATKSIDELRESNKKSDDLIKHLEKQLAAKNEKIRTYETELEETEEMRKTILSLMESKRPKRGS